MNWLRRLLKGLFGPKWIHETKNRIAVQIDGVLVLHAYRQQTGEYLHTRSVKLPRYQHVHPGDKIRADYHITGKFLDA